MILFLAFFCSHKWQGPKECRMTAVWREGGCTHTRARVCVSQNTPANSNISREQQFSSWMQTNINDSWLRTRPVKVEFLPPTQVWTSSQTLLREAGIPLASFNSLSTTTRSWQVFLQGLTALSAHWTVHVLKHQTDKVRWNSVKATTAYQKLWGK